MNYFLSMIVTFHAEKEIYVEIGIENLNINHKIQYLLNIKV